MTDATIITIFGSVITAGGTAFGLWMNYKMAALKAGQDDNAKKSQLAQKSLSDQVEEVHKVTNSNLKDMTDKLETANEHIADLHNTVGTLTEKLSGKD